ncbi:ABC transporter permease subunit [Pelagibius litoralis]|uniref:ABC transporter permease subunit n=1 Tax=Pelagibius litoralis TaxID=374515 RepID=A0A967F1I8_9PROT|nr:ABC transporter permease subunit [Pelagibius litoralis]NIA71333.1 ABC transporter permease subunit [Pelagibius litoralis]
MSALIRSRSFRRGAFQIGFLALLIALIVAAALVGRANILSQGMATGFGFLEQTTGWTVGFSVIDVGPRSTYAHMLFVGILNTLAVGLLTLVLASLLGLVLALMRVSTNTPMQIVGGTYIELFRNVPLILQVLFWYALLTHTPSPRNAISFVDVAFFSNRGLTLPVPALSGLDVLILVAGLVVLAFAFRGLSKSFDLRQRILGAIAAFAALFLVLLLTGRAPEMPLISVPALKGLRFDGGFTLKPEFTALLIGLVLFGASYIGEITRGGLLSVDKGKLEAGAALGFNSSQINRFIRIPLAFRAMLPALANQYVWLMKGTTVGIVIGYPDYFAVVSTSINQSGQTLELLALLMIGFVIINYSIGFAMNVLNDRLKLKGRS